MEWLIGGLVAAVLATVSAIVWWQWIRPWREVEEAVEAATASITPSAILFSRNSAARRIGLNLEKVAQRQRDLAQRLEEGEFSVRAIFEAVLDGILVVDPQRRIRLCNPSFSRIFELQSVSPASTLLENVRDAAVDRMVIETLQTGEARFNNLSLNKRGGEIQIEVSSVPLRDAGKTMRGAVVLFRDVTRLHNTEQMRRDFVANVSHELRTPLSILSGYIETLLENPKQPPAELMRILGVMEKHSNRLTMLVEDILSLAQIEAPTARLQLTEIYLPDFLGAIVRDWQKRFEEKLLRCFLECSEELPIIRADENRLQEIIYNLLDNAVKYSQPEGLIWARATAEGGQVRIAITDQGIGVSARDLPRIFERFYRADKARSREVGGTGLGLAIVKHIAQLHGGTVEAKSQLENGTTITVMLPAHPEPPIP